MTSNRLRITIELIHALDLRREFVVEKVIAHRNGTIERVGAFRWLDPLGDEHLEKVLSGELPVPKPRRNAIGRREVAMLAESSADFYE